MQILVCSTWHTVHRLDPALTYREPLRSAKARPVNPLDKARAGDATYVREPRFVTGVGLRAYGLNDPPPAANIVLSAEGAAQCLGDFGFMYYETGDARDAGTITISVPVHPKAPEGADPPASPAVGAAVLDALEDFVLWLTQERRERAPSGSRPAPLGSGKALVLTVPRRLHVQRPEKTTRGRKAPPLVLDTSPTEGIYALNVEALPVVAALAERLGL